MKIIMPIVTALLFGANTGVAQKVDVGLTPQATNRPASIATTIGKALHFLKESQNPDGSWGSGQKSYTTTALALSALSRNVKTKTSYGFGETVVMAHKWLLAARPESSAESCAIAVALSEYYILHLDTSTAQRVAAILQVTDAPIDSIWADILSTTRLPNESQRPKWCSTPKQVHEKYASQDSSIAPLSSDDYLKMFMAGRAKFRSGKTADAHYQYLRDKIRNSQQDDGSFPTSRQEDRIAATALVLLSLVERQHGAVRFWPPSIRKEVEPSDSEIKIKTL